MLRKVNVHHMPDLTQTISTGSAYFWVPGTKSSVGCRRAHSSLPHSISFEVMEAEELEQNLRLFAMRKAAAASKEFSDLKSRVVVSVQSGPSRHCPMHGKHGNYQLPSRKEMARELRLASAKEAREAKEKRSQSLEPTFSNSMPRRMSNSSSLRSSSASINRHGSFQDVKKDTFTPRVDFKNTLRQFNPKDEERSRGHFQGQARSRHDSEPMDYHDSNAYFTQQLTQHNPYAVNPRRGMTASNFDLDNAGPASLPLSLNQGQRFKTSRPTTPLKSPINSRPQSPRRVEFADEVFFNFNGHHVYQRSASSDLQIAKAKPILRNVNSDAGVGPTKRPISLIEQFESQQSQLPEPLSPLVIEHTNLDDEHLATKNEQVLNQRKVSKDDSLVQIYVPNAEESDDETLSARSSSPNAEPSSRPAVKRTLSAEVKSSSKRQVPPMLSDWNRSQSFPPPKAASETFESDGLKQLAEGQDLHRDTGKLNTFGHT